MPDDFASDITTTGQLIPGTPVFAEVETLADYDWFKAEFTAWNRYIITIDRHEGANGGLDGATIELSDAEGLNRPLFAGDLQPD